MAKSGEPRRLQHLQAASSILQNTSPPVSAFLSSMRRTVAVENEIDLTTNERSQTCNACGTMLIPGWSCKIERETPGGKTRQARLSRSTVAGVKRTKLRCSTCSAVTVISSRKPPKVPKTAPNTAMLDAVVSESKPTAPSVPDKAPSATVASRKARNKKSSLQSLLAGQKAASSGAGHSGLNLMDFMKT